MPRNGSCLDYFRRPRVGSGTGAAAKARCCAVSREILFCRVWVYCLGFWHSVGCLRDSHPERRKPESPLRRLLTALSITLSPSMDRKLKLKLQGTGSLSSVTSEMGKGGGPQASTFPFAPAETAAPDRLGEGKNPWLSCTP